MNDSFKSTINYLIRPGLQCVAFVLFSLHAKAQVKVNEVSEDAQNVVLYADARLAALTGYQEAVKSSVNNLNAGAKNVSGSIHSARGYRVIIYSGIDRAKANSTKADFMRRHPGTRVYMSYALPQYRVKVGDYTSRQEANEFYRKLSSTYSPCMVVPDIVEVNTFRKND